MSYTDIEIMIRWTTIGVEEEMTVLYSGAGTVTLEWKRCASQVRVVQDGELCSGGLPLLRGNIFQSPEVP